MDNFNNLYNLTSTRYSGIKTSEDKIKCNCCKKSEIPNKQSEPSLSKEKTRKEFSQRHKSYYDYEPHMVNCFTSKDHSKLNFDNCTSYEKKIQDYSNNLNCNKTNCDPCNKNVIQMPFCCYIKSLVPNSGPETSQYITINGYNLTCVNFVLFDAKKITDFTIVDNCSIQFTTLPFNNKRTVSVAVGNNNFTSNELYYTYLANPILNNIMPNTGPINGQNIITISGLNLTTTEFVSFGKNKSFNFSIINDQTLQVIAPASTIKNTTINVTVKTSANSSNPLSYTYVSPPII